MSLRQESVCTNNQLFSGSPGIGNPVQVKVASPWGTSDTKHHLQHVCPVNGQEDALEFVKSVGTFSQNVKAEVEFGWRNETMVQNQSMYPKRLSFRSSSRQFLSTRTYRSRKTFLPRKASMSLRASMPTRLIIRPWAPTTMCFWDSRAT